ncbi:MAG: hypothetical protein JWP29_1348 [Rhodoferax sp.]|nr:hypothetical protein [Rhodoferax sp.]
MRVAGEATDKPVVVDGLGAADAVVDAVVDAVFDADGDAAALPLSAVVGVSPEVSEAAVAVPATAGVLAGTTVVTSRDSAGRSARVAAKADMPRATSVQPVSLHTATRPPITPTVSPSRSTAVYSVPRMPIIPAGVSRR